jgi:hypothetical protein
MRNIGFLYTKTKEGVSMNKKLFAALFVAMVLAVSTAYAQTEADFTVGLTNDGEGVIITGCNGKAVVIRIPATIQGMSVREIGERVFDNNQNITSVVIPTGVTKIGNYAFNNCRKLTSVNIPEGITEIGNFAFANCPLTTITLPQSLETIGWKAFMNTKITAITIPAITKIGEAVFMNCYNLRTVKLTEGIEKISKEMFYHCWELTAITLPASIKEIDVSAFEGCRNMVTVDIPDSVEIISFGYDAFNRCPKLSLASQAALKKRGYKDSF